MEGVRSQTPGNPANKLKPLFVLYYNARSILRKMDNFHSLASLHNPDVIAIVVSWLCSDITDSEVSIPGYQVIRLDRDRHGGGIIVYVLEKYTVKILNKGPLDLEFFSTSIHHALFKACLCVLYRPPNSPSSYFDNLHSVLETMDCTFFFNLFCRRF